MSVDALVATQRAVPSRAARSAGLDALAVVAGLGTALAAPLVAGRHVVAPLGVLAAVALVWTVAGAVVARRRPGPQARLVQLAAVVSGLGALTWSLERYRELDGVAAGLVDVGERLSVALAPAVAFHFLLTLPDGRLVRTRRRQVVVVAYLVAVATACGLLAQRDHIVVWPVVTSWVLVLTSVPVAHAAYRALPAGEQRRLQWIGWATAVAAELSLVTIALSLVVDWPHHLAAISLAASALVPVALVAGTLPRLLARVDRLLTHTVSFTGLTALVVLTYLLALAAFGRRPNGSERTLLLLSMVAAAVAAGVYQPARAWLADRANRLVYGERVSPDAALRTWGSRLTRAIPLDELLLQLCEALRKSMQLSSAQVWTGSDGHYELAAMVPHRLHPAYDIAAKERSVVSRAGVSGGTWVDIWLPGLVPAGTANSTRVAPIAHSGELLGLIVCRRPADGVAFTPEDDGVLTELARQVGLALHNVQLDTALQASLDELRQANEELRASRQRIVAAGDAERRKLERNLHDGAQQHLVALAVKLRLAKDAVADDPEDAEVMIDEIRNNLQEAITELRALAHGIFPPLLVSGGLAEALPAAAARAALPTTADVTVGRHDPDVEAAVYFCCVEALQNAGKHAGPAASAAIRVWDEPNRLCWEVRDDGPGFDPGVAGAGHGFVNMRDRMGSFGGAIEVESSPGRGATVRGHLPVAG